MNYHTMFLPSMRSSRIGTTTKEGKSSILCGPIALHPPGVVRAVSLGEMDPLLQFHYSHSFTPVVFPFLPPGEGAE